MDARPRFDLTLYLVAGSADTPDRRLAEVIEAAARGGATLVQLREKSMADAAMIDLAREIKDRLHPYGLPLIINDRVEVALAAGAAGVHLGTDDIGAAQARAALGPEMIIGVSAGTPDEAALVDPAVADYTGVGSVYATATKADAGPPIGIEGLKALKELIPLPVVAIGGIGADRAEAVMASGVAGIAVVSAICGASDPEAAARNLRRAIDLGRAKARRGS
jgi:thiamine-phosphate pyrophosphorylase